jgi:hypothetical protein
VQALKELGSGNWTSLEGLVQSTLASRDLRKMAALEHVLSFLSELEHQKAVLEESLRLTRYASRQSRNRLACRLQLLKACSDDAALSVQRMIGCCLG